MFSPFHNPGHSDDSTPGEPSHSEKDVAVATEIMELDPDTESDVNPGELTFEEGQSSQYLCVFNKSV